ncbi:cupin domain-containing protein [Roseomonas sp. SSH11]|uniref:Cupin domain-containing protein n=1 Tax=Pararoseomonas baculiformis TaxID=2820812 RepID=A0ABS4AHL4_9PROT|nr:cupin domain-containing protein [Pararoseomonas baculiformis]MBP0446517.1 cupin domain-containing protein [Pararoseomonas baculiformis]
MNADFLPAAAGPVPPGSIHLLGNLLRFHATAASTGGSFSLVEACTAPGQGSPPHLQRRDVEAFFVLEGTYEFTLGGSVQTHGPGGFVFVPKDVPHHFRNPAERPARMLILNVPGGLHEGFFRDAGEPVEQGDAFPPMVPPDVPRLCGIAASYGIEILPPG